MKVADLELTGEWLELVEEAMNSGVKKEEFIKFLIKKEKEINNEH